MLQSRFEFTVKIKFWYETNRETLCSDILSKEINLTID